MPAGRAARGKRTSSDAVKAAVATVLLESSGRYDTESRIATMREVVDVVQKRVAGPILVLFPAGWFVARTVRVTDRDVRSLVRRARGMLLRRPRVTVSFGLDGRLSTTGTALDQLGFVVARAGVLAAARKFYPAAKESPVLAHTWDAGERGYQRVANVAGTKYFLSICYDIFGIRHRALARPDVDAVLDLVHGFLPYDGERYFACHGLAGASRQWRVPVFAAAVFRNRRIPPAWPSGVRWRGPVRSTARWRYDDNPMRSSDTLSLDMPEGRIELRIFRWS